MWQESPTRGALAIRSPAGARGPTVATLQGIPEGREGTLATLRLMRDLARAAVRDPSQRVREVALGIVGTLPERAYFSEIRALHEFVRDRIRYVRDPADLELVATPEKTLQYAQGDCDDKSTLLAALLESIGHPARFVAVGINGGPFSHVLVETRVKNTGVEMRDWMPLETILNKPAGWYPPDATSRYVLKVS